MKIINIVGASSLSIWRSNNLVIPELNQEEVDGAALSEECLRRTAQERTSENELFETRSAPFFNENEA